MRVDTRMVLLGGVISILAAGRAGAQPVEAPFDPVTAQAQLHFQAGRDALAGGDGAAAIRELETAQSLRPSPVLDYYLGSAYDQQGQACAAIDHYRRYLAAVPMAENRAQVELRAAQLEPSCRPAPAPIAAPAPAPVYGAPIINSAHAPVVAAAPLAVAVKRASRWKVWLAVGIGCTLAVALIAGIALAATLPGGGSSHHHDWHLDGSGHAAPAQGLVLFRF